MPSNVNDFQFDAAFTTLMPITDTEFERVQRFVYRHFGINLTKEKRTLVVGRLQKYLKENQYQSFTEYLDHLEKNPTPDEMSELINRISTNHTFFYRENDHFSYLKQTALPDVEQIMAEEGTKDFRMWCAAAATGEEPYTLAMLLKDYFGMRYSQFNAGLLATDISIKALKTAQRAIYTEDRINKLPDSMRSHYLKKVGPDTWRVRQDVIDEVLFRRFNLMTPSFPFKKKFHIIFCRNVMIYFDRETRLTLTQKMYDVLMPGGYLFIGHSETLGRDDSNFDYICPAVYRKPLERK